MVALGVVAPLTNISVLSSFATIKGNSIEESPFPSIKIYSFPICDADTIWSKAKSARLLSIPPNAFPELTATGLSDVINAPIAPSKFTGLSL